jgi:hypothetical protein
MVGEPLPDAAAVVRWLGAVQSQDYGPAKWSVAMRTTGLLDATLDQALADGTIVRTHALRPTWHFVLPEDIRWLQQVTGPRVHAFNAYYYRQFELDDALLETCATLIGDALTGGNQLTRRQVAGLLAGAGVIASGPRLAYILMYAELEQIVCSGALAGRQHTYGLLDERAPEARILDPDEALAELTLRYFTSHGPATVKDFRWWSSLTVSEIQRGLELVGDAIDHADVGDLRYWFAPGAVPAADGAEPAVHLLQPYDEYIVGYVESKFLLNTDAAAQQDLPPRPGAYNNVILLGTQVAGRWKRTIQRDTVHVDAVLYHPFTAAQKESLHAVVAAHGSFLGLPATVAVEQRA